MATETKHYYVAGIFVEATKSEGGSFYELTVVKTGDKQRYLADVFENVAVPAGTCFHRPEPHPKTFYCPDWRHV